MQESEKNLHAKIFDLAREKDCQAFEDSRVKFNASFHFKDKMLTEIKTSEGIFRVWKAPIDFFKMMVLFCVLLTNLKMKKNGSG